MDYHLKKLFLRNLEAHFGALEASLGVKEVTLEMQRIILGLRGSHLSLIWSHVWSHAVVEPHPEVTDVHSEVTWLNLESVDGKSWNHTGSVSKANAFSSAIRSELFTSSMLCYEYSPMTVPGCELYCDRCGLEANYICKRWFRKTYGVKDWFMERIPRPYSTWTHHSGRGAEGAGGGGWYRYSTYILAAGILRVSRVYSTKKYHLGRGCRGGGDTGTSYRHTEGFAGIQNIDWLVTTWVQGVGRYVQVLAVDIWGFRGYTVHRHITWVEGVGGIQEGTSDNSALPWYLKEQHFNLGLKESILTWSKHI